jgi:hypothetical protein
MAQQVENHPVLWYRSTYYCSILVAIVAFMDPGMYNALNGLGAGGGVHPDISNAANSIIYGLTAGGSYFAAAFANRITPKYALLASSLNNKAIKT